MKERRKGATSGLRGLWSQWSASEAANQSIDQSCIIQSAACACCACISLSLLEARSEQRAGISRRAASADQGARRGDDNDKRKGVERTEGSANADSGCHQAAGSKERGRFLFWDLVGCLLAVGVHI